MIVDIDNMHINIHEKLKVAVVQQNLNKVQKYLAQGADVNYTNKQFPDDPALIQAMQYSKPKAISKNGKIAQKAKIKQIPKSNDLFGMGM